MLTRSCSIKSCFFIRFLFEYYSSSLPSSCHDDGNSQNIYMTSFQQLQQPQATPVKSVSYNFIKNHASLPANWVLEVNHFSWKLRFSNFFQGASSKLAAQKAKVKGFFSKSISIALELIRDVSQTQIGKIMRCPKCGNPDHEQSYRFCFRCGAETILYDTGGDSCTQNGKQSQSSDTEGKQEQENRERNVRLSNKQSKLIFLL